MRKLLILVCAFLIIASLSMQKAEAYVLDATYVSMLSTSVGGEAAWLKCDYTTSLDLATGYYFYSYTAYIKDFDGHSLPSGYTYLADLQAVKVSNASHNPVVVESSPTSPLKWKFNQDIHSIYYQWTVDNYDVDLLYPPTMGTGELNTMIIKSKFGPTYVGAAVWDGGPPTSSGNTIGPAPEPASLSLLGLSLLGLGGMFRRKFKA